MRKINLVMSLLIGISCYTCLQAGSLNEQLDQFKEEVHALNQNLKEKIHGEELTDFQKKLEQLTDHIIIKEEINQKFIHTDCLTEHQKRKVLKFLNKLKVKTTKQLKSKKK